MLKVKLTDNYTGFNISGDYKDLNCLYDAFHYFICNDYDNLGKCMMQTHIYGFLYDVRHAYGHSREYELVNNGLDDNSIEWLGLTKDDVTENNMYFSFNYYVPDLILDIILIKNFINVEDKIYNSSYNMVNFFYSLVIESFYKILDEKEINKIKTGIMNANIRPDNFLPQWFEKITIDYIKMDKQTREKEITKILDYMYNYNRYNEYLEMKKDLEKTCIDKNCNLDQLHVKETDYPKEIIW